MIYCNLKGGLGNMMFQIAATLSIAKDNNTQAIFPNLKKHLNYLNEEKTHNPSLNYADQYHFLNIFKKLNCWDQNISLKIYNFPFHYENLKIENPNCEIFSI